VSDDVARAALSRMNLREIAVAPHYTGIGPDLKLLASTDVEDGKNAFMARRAELCAAYGLDGSVQSKPFAFAGGVAIIPITGLLINRFGQSYGFITGYNFLRSQVALAGQDADVKAIVYDVNSFGGEAAGCFECSADMKRLANGKPTMAVVDSNCYSAAFATASSADKIVSTPSGGIGSVGVVAMHVDMSKMLAEWGIDITFIFAGDHKVDGNPYEALSAEVKADIQASIDKSMNAFVSLIATNRGMTEKAVRDTQARSYRAEDALALGFIDAIASPSEAVHAFLGELSGSTLHSQQEVNMTDATKPGAETKAEPANTEAAAAEARTTERARISGIQGCEEAKGRESLANHLALNTDMSVDAAKAVLAASPKTEPVKTETANPFKAAMDGSKHPNVGAETGSGGNGGDGAEAPHLAILRAQEQATGVKLLTAA
jgi:signal peptide peptidase SppA